MKFLLAVCGGMHLAPIARALQDRDALAELWTTTRNSTGISPGKFRRAWAYHLAMKPFYHLTSAGITEKFSHLFFPLWKWWFRLQKAPPCDVAYGIPGYATEMFDLAERAGALKLLDGTSSHPTSAYGFWQRECDIFCPGSKPGVPRWLFARWNREIERADLIVCPSLFVRDSMLYNGIPEAKLALNHYGVDTSIFTARASVPQKPRFICVGAIQLRKGQQYLLRAFEKVRKVLPEAELVLVGRYFPDFKFERARWAGTYRHFHNIPFADLTQLLRDSTAFVFPSNEEGFAKAIIEAMASGLPIIATHESGATTLVEDGVHGYIVRGRDADQLADRMIKAATDRAANERMGRAAHDRGAKGNTWTDFADRAITICEEVLRKKGGAEGGERTVA